MRIVTSPAALARMRAAWRKRGENVAFVPTMGALHDAHMELVRRARRSRRLVIVSVFVNPTQFGPNEDFSRYPRPFRADAARCRAAGVDVLYHPSPRAMYPKGFRTVAPPAVAAPLEGRFRPGHFRGVATVVLKLLAQTEPDELFLGEKDFQQLAVVRRLVSDRGLPVRVTGVATVRAKDGLALSSRNAYLSAEERKRAPAFHRALKAGAAAARKPKATAASVRKAMREALAPARPDSIDYLEIVDAATLKRPKRLKGKLRLLGALRIGRTRLIDNIGVEL